MEKLSAELSAAVVELQRKSRIINEEFKQAQETLQQLHQHTATLDTTRGQLSRRMTTAELEIRSLQDSIEHCRQEQAESRQGIWQSGEQTWRNKQTLTTCLAEAARLTAAKDNVEARLAEWDHCRARDGGETIEQNKVDSKKRSIEALRRRLADYPTPSTLAAQTTALHTRHAHAHHATTQAEAALQQLITESMETQRAATADAAEVATNVAGQRGSSSHNWLAVNQNSALCDTDNVMVDEEQIKKIKEEITLLYTEIRKDNESVGDLTTVIDEELNFPDDINICCDTNTADANDSDDTNNVVDIDVDDKWDEWDEWGSGPAATDRHNSSPVHGNTTEALRSRLSVGRRRHVYLSMQVEELELQLIQVKQALHQ